MLGPYLSPITGLFVRHRDRSEQNSAHAPSLNERDSIGQNYEALFAPSSPFDLDWELQKRNHQPALLFLEQRGCGMNDGLPLLLILLLLHMIYILLQMLGWISSAVLLVVICVHILYIYQTFYNFKCIAKIHNQYFSSRRSPARPPAPETAPPSV